MLDLIAILGSGVKLAISMLKQLLNAAAGDRATFGKPERKISQSTSNKVVPGLTNKVPYSGIPGVSRP
jgi:hypothetical protein